MQLINGTAVGILEDSALCKMEYTSSIDDSQIYLVAPRKWNPFPVGTTRNNRGIVQPAPNAATILWVWAGLSVDPTHFRADDCRCRCHASAPWVRGQQRTNGTSIPLQTDPCHVHMTPTDLSRIHFDVGKIIMDYRKTKWNEFSLTMVYARVTDTRIILNIF